MNTPNLQRPLVVESYCRICGVFVSASPDPYLLLRAELEPYLFGLALRFIEPSDFKLPTAEVVDAVVVPNMGAPDYEREIARRVSRGKTLQSEW